MGGNGVERPALRMQLLHLRMPCALDRVTCLLFLLAAGQTGIAKACVSCAPPIPPAVKPMRRWVAAKRSVRRAHGATTVGRRSVKIRRAQLVVVQKNLRAW